MLQRSDSTAQGKEKCAICKQVFGKKPRQVATYFLCDKAGPACLAAYAERGRFSESSKIWQKGVILAEQINNVVATTQPGSSEGVRKCTSRREGLGG